MTYQHEQRDAGAGCGLAILVLQLSVQTVDSLPLLADDVGSCRRCPRWSPGVNRWLGETRRVPRRGVLGPWPVSAIRAARILVRSGSRPRRQSQGGCSPAIDPATGCSGRCIGPGSPASRRRVDRRRTYRDGAWVTGGQVAPPDNKPMPDERRAPPFRNAKLDLLTELRVGCASVPACTRQHAPSSGAPAEVRPRCRGRRHPTAHLLCRSIRASRTPSPVASPRRCSTTCSQALRSQELTDSSRARPSAAPAVDWRRARVEEVGQ